MNILTQNNQASLTSQQIAVLVGSTDSNVKLSISRLIARGVISETPMANGIKAANGITPVHYVFTGEKGKRDSIIVVAQLSPEFTAALVDRWNELEQRAAQPVAPSHQIPQSFAEALQLAANQALKIEQDAPKVSFYDTVAASSSLMTVSDAAKKISMSAQELNKKLIAIGAYDKRRLPKKVFSHDFITKGYGVMKLTEDGYDRNLLTQSGQIYVIGLFSRSRELEAV